MPLKKKPESKPKETARKTPAKATTNGKTEEKFDNAKGNGKSRARTIDLKDKSIRSVPKTFFGKDMKDGDTKRVFILSEFKMTYAHTVDRKYYECLSTFNDNGTLKKRAICCERTGTSPDKRYGCIVLVYDTDKDGKLRTEKPQDITFSIEIWSLNQQKLDAIAKLSDEWELSEHDLLVTMNDSNFKNMSIVAAKDAKVEKSGLRERVEEAYATYEFKDAGRFIARKTTEEQYEELLPVVEED